MRRMRVILMRASPANAGRLKRVAAGWRTPCAGGSRQSTASRAVRRTKTLLNLAAVP